MLGDGQSASIRPLTPDDREALAAFHRNQSTDSIYKRFFSPKPELTSRDLDHFTAVDMVDRAAVLVELHGEMVGWASYERWAGRNEAEVAFMVDDRHQGLGMATLMLEHLAAIARSNGIQGFTAEVLGDNRAMLAVFAKAGWPLQRRFDSGVVDLDWELADTDDFRDSVEQRERRADARAVARILLPRAIAVVGASNKEGSVGWTLWNHVVHSAAVPVYPVNPSSPDIDGRRCFARILDLPDEVSLAILAVPAQALEASIEACIDKRIRGAVIVTSIDTPDVDIDVDQIVARARRNGLRLIGPSSMGIASLHPRSRLQAALVDVTLPAGGVAVSLQSGTLGAALLRHARDLDLGLSWFVSLGDKSDVSANDLLQFWEGDDDTHVIAMYTEAFGNQAKFARIARRVSRSKPIVAVRTGAAAGGAAGSALYQQAGLIEVPTVQALLDTCRVLSDQPVLRGPHVAVISNSPSPTTLARAALRAEGLEPVEPAVHVDWRSGIGDFEAALRAELANGSVDGVMVIHAPAVISDVNSPAEAIDRTARGAAKPVVAVMLGGGDAPIVPGSRVPAFSFPEQAAGVLGRSYSYARWLTVEASIEHDPVRAVDPAAAASLIDEALDDDGSAVLDVQRTRRLLWSYGIEMALARSATPDTAEAIADEIGYPVAVKALHRRPGRSARAGVALDLADGRDVVEAIATMTESLGDDAEQLVVQKMVAPGVDVRVRCDRDDRLGAIVTIGLGGEQAEVIGDRSSRLAPLSPAIARSMLRETRAGVALGESGFDESPLVDLVVSAAQLIADHRAVTSIDLNPVMVSTVGAFVTDATVVIGRPTTVEPPLRSL